MVKEFSEKIITINLLRAFEKPSTKRATSAKYVVLKKVEKETRLKNLKISNKVNEELWSRGRNNSPRKITVKVIKDKDIGRIMLPEEKLETKKTKEKPVKEETKIEETKETKKEETTKTKKEQQPETKTEEKKPKKE